MKNSHEGLVGTVKTDKGYKGMNPNTAQKRPNTIKPSPPKPANFFNVRKSQGR